MRGYGRCRSICWSRGRSSRDGAWIRGRCRSSPNSIRARGILQPLLVRPHPGADGRFEIIAGERRWRAAAQAGLHEVPVLVRALDNSDAMAAALVENLQRQDLNPLEEAEGYQQLLDEFGLTQDMLAQAVGKSRSHIANTLRLLNLPPAIKQAVLAGDVTAGHARALLSHPSPVAALGEVMGRGLSVRQTEALVARKPRAEPQAVRKDPNVEMLGRELTAELGLRVEIAGGIRGGSVRIHYGDLDQLELVGGAAAGVGLWGCWRDSWGCVVWGPIHA